MQHAGQPKEEREQGAATVKTPRVQGLAPRPERGPVCARLAREADRLAELALSLPATVTPPIVPPTAEAAARTEQPSASPSADRPLGPSLPAVELDIAEAFRCAGEIQQLLAELALGASGHKWGIVNSAAWRLRAAATRIGAGTEPAKLREARR